MRPILAGVSRRAGEKRILLGVVAALVTAALVAPALAGDNGAQKVDFRGVDSIASCDLPTVTRDDKSSAIINWNPAGTEVRAQVQLKDALPNTTYTLFLSMNRCQINFVDSVRTNNQGNGNEQIGANIGTFEPGIIFDVSLQVIGGSGGATDRKQTPTVRFGP